MTLTKNELREMIREALREELNANNKLTEARQVPEESVLANHVGEDPDFEAVCLAGDAQGIMALIEEKMDALNMHTPGATKFHDTIKGMIGGKARLSSYTINKILFYVSNCRLVGYGMKSPDARA